LLLISFEFPYLRLSLFLQGLPRRGADALVLQAGLSRVREKIVDVSVSVWGGCWGPHS
jgi:hypothetical protein